MRPISTTEIAPLKIKIVDGEGSAKFKLPASRIGWVRSMANKPGTSFNIVLRDGLGRVMFEQPECKTETKEFGQFMGIEGRIGEEIEVSLENVKGADEIDLFLN